MSKPDVPNIAAPAFKANPWSVCAHLRAEQPVAPISLPGGQAAYLITRHEDAAVVLRDERFVKNPRNARDGHEVKPNWMPKALRPMSNLIVNADGDDHRRLRNLVRDAFTPRYIAHLEPRIEALATELLSRMARSRRVDLVADYALRLPLTVISEMMGVPEHDRLRFRRWVAAFVALTPAPRPTLSVLLKVPRMVAMMRFLRRLVAERRANPRDDLVSRLAAMEEAGDRLSEDELLAMVFILLVAGYETTVNLIATGTLLLLTHPAELRRLREEPALIEPAVEELLRLAAPVDVASERFAREDVQLAGVTIPRGALVLVGIVSTNADQDRFSDPERLDWGRSGNHHLTFGMGNHYCLGAPLARMEGRIAIGRLVERFPDLGLAVPPERLRWRRGLSLRGLRSLPVKVG